MSKKRTVITGLCLLFALVMSLSLFAFFPAVAEESAREQTDFFSNGAGVYAAVGTKDTETRITLPYDENGTIYFRESAQKPYPVDMSVFGWNVKIDALAVGQSFTVSFLKDASAAPFEGAVGVSYVFECVDESRVLVYVVDAADGTVIKEMVETQSMWAYKKDGTFKEYPKTEDGVEHYSYGMVGELGTSSLLGATIAVANTVDAASFAGTTYRPSVSNGNSLGTTIPGEIFSARDMKIKECVLALTAGGLHKTEGEEKADLSFTVETPNDKATKQYFASADRMQIVNALTDYSFDAKDALSGTLSAEKYFAMVEGFAGLDISSLRVRDRFNLQEKINLVQADLSALEQRMESVPQAVTAYGAALSALENLAQVTEDKIEEAYAARATYLEYSEYVKYLSEEQADALKPILAGLNETLLTRGELHLEIVAYESAVAEFATPVTDTGAELIVRAERAAAAIQKENLSLLTSEDQKAFQDRISACDKKVTAARVLNAYDVETHKINLYKSAIASLSGSVNAEEFAAVLAERPALKTSDVMPSDAQALAAALRAADESLGKEIVRVLENMFAAYEEKTFALGELSSLTRDKIAAAKAAAYDEEALAALCAIAEEIGYDVSASVAKLSECDRAVSAAEVRVLTVEFNLATDSLENLSALHGAYEKYLLVAASDTSILSQSEKTAYDSLLAAATERYESAAKALVEPLLKAFEDALAVENIKEFTAVEAAKAAREAVPSLDYLIVEEDRTGAQTRYNAANDALTSLTLYYVTTSGTSWTPSETERGLLLSSTLKENNSCDGLAIVQDPLQIDGFDFAFEFTKIGRIWKGEDPAGSGKHPQSILVMNIMREAGKNKDETQGFSVYFFCNHLNELEVVVYGAQSATGEVQLASGKVENCGFTAEPYTPYTVRVRVEKTSTSYRLYVNSLQLNLYFRDFINPAEDRKSHLPEFEEGEEIGAEIFKDGNAYVTFIYFADSLTEEERTSEITIRMIGNKTFGGYVAPVFTKSVELISGPTKTVYQKGESFEIAGVQMKATLSDGSVIDVPLNKIKVLGFTSTSKGKKNVTLSYTDDSGVTLNKVIQVEIVEAEEQTNGGKGCGGCVAILGSVGGAVLLAAVATVLVLLKKKKGV